MSENARQLQACLINYSICCHFQTRSLPLLSFPPRLALLLPQLTSGCSGLRPIHWEAYLPCESPQAGGVLGLAVVPGSHCTGKRKSGIRLPLLEGEQGRWPLGTHLPALGGKGLGQLRGQLSTSDPALQPVTG